MSINSSKFPNEVSHTKFDLLYFVKEVFNGKEIRHASSLVPIQQQLKEWRKSLVWLLRKLMYKCNLKDKAHEKGLVNVYLFRQPIALSETGRFQNNSVR